MGTGKGPSNKGIVGIFCILAIIIPVFGYIDTKFQNNQIQKKEDNSLHFPMPDGKTGILIMEKPINIVVKEEGKGKMTYYPRFITGVNRLDIESPDGKKKTSLDGAEILEDTQEYFEKGYETGMSMEEKLLGIDVPELPDNGETHNDDIEE